MVGSAAVAVEEAWDEVVPHSRLVAYSDLGFQCSCCLSRPAVTSAQKGG